ncbi:hypothetical protein ACHAQJ_003841 [Trichoderma viride]
MKSSILSLAFVATLAAAQAGIPSCATGCVTKFTTGSSIAGCQQLDIACICKNSDFLDGIACCLTTACDAASQTQAVKYAQQICSSAGVSTPDQVVCKENSSSQSETATASDKSSSSATTGSSETTASSDSSTTAADSSSSTAPATDSTSAPTTTNSGSQTTASTGSSTAAGSTTSSAASSTSSNVAAPLASAGSLVGAAIAMLAAAL